MEDTIGIVPDTFSKTVRVHAPVKEVWEALTNSSQVRIWMMDGEIGIHTDWKAGSPFIIKGTEHWVYFENKGVILRSEPERVLAYSHLSSLSRLPDTPENYTITEFRLTRMEEGTELMLCLSNFPTESIYRHLFFYWNTTLLLLKNFIELNRSKNYEHD